MALTTIAYPASGGVSIIRACCTKQPSALGGVPGVSIYNSIRTNKTSWYEKIVITTLKFSAIRDFLAELLVLHLPPHLHPLAMHTILSAKYRDVHPASSWRLHATFAYARRACRSENSLLSTMPTAAGIEALGSTTRASVVKVVFQPLDPYVPVKRLLSPVTPKIACLSHIARKAATLGSSRGGSQPSA